VRTAEEINKEREAADRKEERRKRNLAKVKKLVKEI